MASAEETSLNEIWRAWGLRTDPTLAGAQVQAVAALKAWLAASDQKPEHALRSVQVILLDPERPDAANRPCVKPIHDLVIDSWKGGGTHEHFVVFLQAMLLAAWPGAAATWGGALAHLVRGASLALRGRERQAPRIQAWLAGLPEAPLPVASPSEVVADLVETTISPSLMLPNFPQDKLDFLAKNSGQGWSWAQTSGSINPLFNAVWELYQRLPAAEAALVEQCENALEGMRQYMQSVTSTKAPVSPELDLLWWGQAGYSHHLRRPLRHIADVGTRVLWGSLEAAERSRDLPTEPAASFLVETLRRLGLDVDQKRPLLEWMRELHAAIRAAPQFPKIQPQLAEFAREDALGLSITWVRMHASERFDDAAAREGVALALDVDVDLGDFAGLVFRELLLDLRFSGMQ